MSSPTCYQIILTPTFLLPEWQCLSCIFWTSSTLCCVVSTGLCCDSTIKYYYNIKEKKSYEYLMPSSFLCCVQWCSEKKEEDSVKSNTSDESVESIISENQI